MNQIDNGMYKIYKNKWINTSRKVLLDKRDMSYTFAVQKHN